MVFGCHRSRFRVIGFAAFTPFGDVPALIDCAAADLCVMGAELVDVGFMASVNGLGGVDELGFREQREARGAATFGDGKRVVLAVVRDLPRLLNKVEHDGDRVRVVDFLRALGGKDFLDGATKEDGEALTGESGSVTLGSEESAKFGTDSKGGLAIGFFSLPQVCAVLIFLFKEGFEGAVHIVVWSCD